MERWSLATDVLRLLTLQDIDICGTDRLCGTTFRRGRNPYSLAPWPGDHGLNASRPRGVFESKLEMFEALGLGLRPKKDYEIDQPFFDQYR
jgi:hypothetical protein